MGIFTTDLHKKLHSGDDATLLSIHNECLDILASRKSNKLTSEVAMVATDLVTSGMLNDFDVALTNNLQFEGGLLQVVIKKLKDRVEELEDKPTTEGVMYSPHSITYVGNKKAG